MAIIMVDTGRAKKQKAGVLMPAFSFVQKVSLSRA
jgi:hypothetical protein